MQLTKVQSLLSQILHSLSRLHRVKLVHLDVKPENILFEDSTQNRVQLIDFGSCSLAGDESITYAQTRYYRSPEIALGFTFGTSADIWSAGCVAAEMFLALPIFAGESTLHLLELMQERLGTFPDWMNIQLHELRSQEPRAPVQSRIVFRYSSLSSIIMEYAPIGDCKLLESREYMEEKTVFLDLLLQMLEFDPEKRITADAALDHPFFKLVC
jgi:serine/threonine protein kinase